MASFEQEGLPSATLEHWWQMFLRGGKDWSSGAMMARPPAGGFMPNGQSLVRCHASRDPACVYRTHSCCMMDDGTRLPFYQENIAHTRSETKSAALLRQLPRLCYPAA